MANPYVHFDMENRYTSSKGLRFFLDKTADEAVWVFQMYVPLDTDLSEDMEAMARVMAWCADNMPQDVYRSPEGFRVFITDPTYATAFRIQWC